MGCYSNSVPTTPAAATNSSTHFAAENEHGGSSSVTRPNKRVKTVDKMDQINCDPLVAAFTSSSERLATTIEKLAMGNMDLPLSTVHTW
jgi:hypothetical protein